MRASNRQQLINNIPTPRFQTYLAAANQDPEKALALYQWNIDVAAAVTSTLAIVEVALRNTIDQQLRKWNIIKGGTYEWITRPQVPLSHIVRPTPPPNWLNSPHRRPGDLHGKWWEAKAQGGMKDPQGNRTNPSPTHDEVSQVLFRLSRWENLEHAKKI